MKSRLNDIEAAQAVLQAAWPALTAEISRISADLVERLIAKDDPETRGRIKALRDLLDLPEMLDAERKGILAAELPDPDSAL